MSRVVGVEPFSLALSRPLGTARGEITEREGFLVRVEAEGRTGVGEATPLPGWTESLTECRAALEDAGSVEDALARARDRPATSHALESARLDATARAANESVAHHLVPHDSPPASQVPVNATVGDGDTTATVAAAREAVDAGYPAVKVKVGARSIEADRDRLEAVRAACPDVSLRADANGAWGRTEATAFLDSVTGLDLAYVEQPLPAEDLAGHATLRGRGVPIAVDESLSTTGVEAVLDHEAADVLVLKPMALGGPVVTRNAALTARERGSDVVLTTTIDGAYARAMAVHVAASLPDVPVCGFATASLLDSDLVTPDPVPVERGSIRVPEGSGIGF